MLISEQKYTNLNRIYYHGQIENFKEDFRIFDEFYLTNTFMYAMYYAFDKEHNFGKIIEYRLREKINIFNMKSKKDEGTLRVYLHNHNPELIKYIEKLKNNDWSTLLKSNRQVLINIIKSLGYDGYFNYELDKNSVDALHKKGIFKYSDLVLKSPSIGIFNKNILTQVNVWNKNNISKNVNYSNIKEREINYLKDLAITKLLDEKQNFKIQIFITNMYEQCLTLSEDDTLQVLKNITKKDLKDREISIDETLKNDWRFSRFLDKKIKESLKDQYSLNMNWIENFEKIERI